MTGEVLASVRVLVVEDEAFSQRFLVRVLKTIGIEQVLTAENGVKALELLGAIESDIDLIISDIEMPEMNGYELVRRVRYGVVPRFKDIPILILTGQNTEENERKGRFHKISGYVVKPPKVDPLRAHITEALGL
jgi:CheY-like chemotaxis protein